MAKKLTKKQEIFVAEYLVHLDATRAAIAAGYSAKSASNIGYLLLQNPRVSEKIAAKTGKRLGKLEITADRVLQETARLAFLDPRKFYKDDGTLKTVPELDDDTAAALAGMDIEEAFQHFAPGQAKPTGIIKKIKFTQKIQALELLGKHLKLFIDHVEHSGQVSIADAIAKGRKAVAERNAA